MSNLERISCAAIRCEGKVYEGLRHVMIRARIFDDLGRYPNAEKIEEGFVTESGRFVARKEAAEIAFDAGQIKEKLAFLSSQDFRPLSRK